VKGTQKNKQDKDAPSWEARESGDAWYFNYRGDLNIWVMCDIYFYERITSANYYSVNISIPGTYRQYRRDLVYGEDATQVRESLMDEAVETAQELLSERAELLLHVAERLVERRVPEELEEACHHLLKHLTHNTSDAAVKELTELVRRASTLFASRK